MAPLSLRCALSALLLCGSFLAAVAIASPGDLRAGDVMCDKVFINTTQSYELYANCTVIGHLTVHWNEAGACPWSFDHVTEVDSLLFSGSLVTSFSDFPALEKLSGLQFHNVPLLTALPSFPALTSLESFALSLCGIEAVSWQSFPLVPSINVIEVSRVPSLSLFSAFNQTVTMDILRFAEVPNPAFQMLSFRQLQSLNNLEFTGANQSVMDWLPALTSVTDSLSIMFPGFLSVELPALTSAGVLRIQSEKATSVAVPVLTSVGVFHFSAAGYVASDLTAFSALTSVRRVSIRNLPHLTSLRGLEGLTSVGYITISSCPRLSSLQGLENVDEMSGFEILPGPHVILRHLPSLQQLAPFNPTRVQHNASLAFQECGLVDVDLSHVTSLQQIILHDSPNATSLNGLTSLQTVRSVSIKNCDRLADLNAFRGVAIRKLQLMGLPIRDVDPFSELSQATQVIVHSNPQLKNVRGFCSLSTPTEFSVSGAGLCCEAVESISDLVEPKHTNIGDCSLHCDTSNDLTCPCRANSCLNGGSCSDLASGYECGCPKGYEGHRCQKVIPALYDLSPAVVYAGSGSVNATLTAQRLPLNKNNFYVMIKGQRGSISSVSQNQSPQQWDPSYSPSSSPPLDAIWDIQFRSPQINAPTSYLPVTVLSANNTYDQNSRYDLLYFTNFDCTQQGYVWDHGSGRCVSCPSGAFCPGGDRMWPLRGYWSRDELSTPIKCAIYDACPGAMGEVSPYSIKVLPAGSRQTDQCNGELGYTGTLCTVCEAGFYAEGARCRPCGLDSEDKKEVIGLVCAAVAFFMVIACGVSLLSDSKLADLVTLLIMLQQFIVVGGFGASRLGENVGRVFGVLAILNFDIQFVKAGCSVPRLTFVSVFWYTMLVFVVAALIFVLAAGLRAKCLKQEVVSRAGVTRRKLFKRRVVHSLIILASITYLQFSIRSLQGLDCTYVNNSLVLRIEPSTRCYHDSHLPTAMFIFVFLVAYLGGFPAWCFYIVHRTAHIEGTASGLSAAKRVEKYGYLYRGTKSRFYWFRVLSFLTNFALACQMTLAQEISLKSFLASVLFVINVAFVTVMWPYKKWFTNLASIVGGVANVVQVLFYLSLIDDRSNNQEAFFYITLVLGIVGTVAGVGRTIHVLCTGQYKQNDSSGHVAVRTRLLRDEEEWFDEQQQEMAETPAAGRAGRVSLRL